MEKYISKIDKIQELFKQSEQQLAEEKLQELKENIIYDVALKNCESNNKKEQLKYAKLLLKNAQKDTNRPLIHKLYKLDNTYQLLDGFVAVVLKEPIAGLEINTNEGQYYDCRTVINRPNKNYYDYDYSYEKVDIDLLELEQLALKIKKSKPPYPTETLCCKNNTYYSPLFLLTAIKILGSKDVEIYFHTSSEKDPIYLKSSLGESIVLPIIVPKDTI